MSAPSSDPPQDPPSNVGDVKTGESSDSSAPSTSTPANDETPVEGSGDVKMEEAKEETVEDTFEDLPDHVKDVRQRGLPCCGTELMIENEWSSNEDAS